MEIDTSKVRELLNKRDEIDAELAGMFITKERKPQKCSKCGSTEHNSRACTIPTPSEQK